MGEGGRERSLPWWTSPAARREPAVVDLASLTTRRELAVVDLASTTMMPCVSNL